MQDKSAIHVWRVERKHGIQPQRRSSWWVSIAPQFAHKAAGVLGLYLDPPESAVVISVDAEPSFQALERAQGCRRLPDGTAVQGHNHKYKRHGTLFAAMEGHTWLVQVRHYLRKRRREFLDFMNGVVAQYLETELDVL